MAIRVEAPQRSPHRFGLFSVAEIIEEPASPVFFGGTVWEPLPCEHPGLWPGPCGTTPIPEEKCAATQPDSPVTTPFTVYGSYWCDLVGRTPQDASDRAVQHLQGGEQHAVEYAVWSGAAGAAPAFAGPDTVDLGTASCAAQLLERIYAYTDVAYSSEVVVHAPRPVMPWLASAGVLVRSADGGRVETQSGTPIAFGSGYTEAGTGPDGTQADPGSYWVYVTGPVVIRRGGILRLPDPPSHGLDRRTNDYLALAERTYLAAWDCITAAIQFTPSC